MEFSIDRYKSRTDRLRWDDLDLGSFRVLPLDEETLRCLRYMHDIEFHTVCYLRDLLVTPAHNDPEVTAFLSFWAFEEFWHGEALAAVLEAHDEPFGDERVGALRAALSRRSKFSPVVTAAFGAMAGPSFTAVHMTWGAVNEWTTQAGYARLAAKADHPVLTDLLSRIMKQEGRHIDFYVSQSHARLATRRAQRLTRFALSKLWRPVGSGVAPAAETDSLIRHLFGGPDGLDVARRIDRRVDRLPGLSGLHLIESVRGERVGVEMPDGSVSALQAA